MGISSSDGNTVSCCENSGVKDQNGNDLRLCSAIDKERVYEENKKNEDNGPRTLVTCVKKHTYETSKGIRTDTGKSYICSDKNGILITKIDNTTALCKAFNYEERFCRVPLSPTECYPTYFSQATQHRSSVGNGFTEYKGKKEDILACFGKTGPDSNILTPDYCLQNPGNVLCKFYN